jgi:cytochrome-b5 reductase
LKKELEHLEATFPSRFKVFYLIDKAPPYSGWVGPTGYVTQELLAQVMPDKSKNIKIFVCGYVSVRLGLR